MGNPTNPYHLFDTEVVFATPFVVSSKFFTIDHLWFYGCLTTLHNINVYLSILDISIFLAYSNNAGLLLWTFLSWYSPTIKKLPLKEFKKVKSFFILRRPYFQTKSGHIWSHDNAYEWMFLLQEPDNDKIQPLIKHLCEINYYNRLKGKVLCTFLNFSPVFDNDPPIQHELPQPFENFFSELQQPAMQPPSSPIKDSAMLDSSDPAQEFQDPYVDLDDFLLSSLGKRHADSPDRPLRMVLILILMTHAIESAMSLHHKIACDIKVPLKALLTSVMSCV